MKQDKEKKKKKKKASEPEVSEVLKQNEVDANRQMVYAALVTAGIFLIVYILYLVGVLPIESKVLVHIFVPTNVALLASTWIWRKTKFFSHPQFKLFLLGAFVYAFFVMACIAPKHAIITWAIPIILSNHYYNTKVSRTIFINCLIGMFIALYIGAFIGEYDTNLLGPGILKQDPATGNWFLFQPDSPAERAEMFSTLRAQGDNRYLKIFLYYFLGRAFALSIIFFASDRLSHRSSKLLAMEISSNVEKKQIETELSVARGIQLSALSPNYSNMGDVSIIAELNATKEVGGDLYYYFKLDDSHVAVCVGDVSGKGVPAAMFMMKTITCLKAYASIDKHPSEILLETNKALIEGNEEMQMFVTCFFAILDTKTGIMEYCNAGHNKPIIGHNDRFRYLECNPGFILGGLEFLPLKDERTRLYKGDALFIYTDGITEAKNENGELYGELRLLKLLNSKKFSTLLEMHYEIKDDIGAFVGKAEQADDMTYLYLRYQGDEIYGKEIDLPASTESVREILDFTEGCLTEIHQEKYLQTYYVVVDEIASNIVKYAYPEEPLDIYLRFLYNKTKQEIILTFVDRGVSFDPTNTDKGKTSVDINGPEGGLGIHIVKSNMDKVTYNRVNDRNILAITKYVDTPE